MCCCCFEGWLNYSKVCCACARACTCAARNVRVSFESKTHREQNGSWHGKSSPQKEMIKLWSKQNRWPHKSPIHVLDWCLRCKTMNHCLSMGGSKQKGCDECKQIQKILLRWGAFILILIHGGFLFRYHIVFGKMPTKTQNWIIWQRSLNRERWNVDSEIEWNWVFIFC